MTIVVFSKDRAMQLDAFLRSYYACVSPLGLVQVLYLATTDRHAKAYSDVFKGREVWVDPHVQSASFKDDLLRMLPVTGNVVFFVDDQVFVQPWDVLEEAGLSLRLGLNVTRNYASGHPDQALPPFQVAGVDLVKWRWADGELAWAYPFSLDGHVYNLSVIRPLVESIEFSSPNTLESMLQSFAPRFSYGLCYRESKVVNVPWNRVQTDWSNRCGVGNGVEELLGHWESGKRIDIRVIHGVKSVHQEFPLALEARP